MNKSLLLLLIIILSPLALKAQENETLRLSVIKSKLDTLASMDKMYLKEVDLSTSRISLPDLLQAVANANAVNISVKGGENTVVSSNFSRARIVDLLYFVCSEYDFDLEVIGNIVSVYPYHPATVKEPMIIEYDSVNNRLTYDIINHNLVEVAKNISSKSGKNIIVPQSMYSKNVSGYLTGIGFAEALAILANTNGLLIEESQDNIWTFIDDSNNVGNRRNYVRRREFANEQMVIDSTGLITVNISNGNIYDIILDVCHKLNLNYHFVTPVNYQTSLFISDVTLETLFSVMFAGTDCGYYVENDIYMFGSPNAKHNMSSNEVFTMKYRTITDVTDIIPAAIKKDVQVQVFPDLNSIILSGSSRDVARVKEFLNSIDKSVPLITMEIIIVDVTKGYVKEVGMDMGFGETPVSTGGKLSPGVNMTFGASSVNNLINGFNGFGNVNLGKVSSNFYLSLKLLEEAGDIKLRSTPMLSTLNGHPATLTSGEKKYYKEVQTNLMGTQNPIQSESYTWKSIEANLVVKITPLVSEDNQITLDVDIEQSEFTPREEKDAPPGTVTRKFKSIVRVEDGEMVLLGGIEKSSDEINSSGLPFLSRSRFFRWLFGSSKKSKSSHKLNIFIKPSVI